MQQILRKIYKLLIQPHAKVFYKIYIYYNSKQNCHGVMKNVYSGINISESKICVKIWKVRVCCLKNLVCRNNVPWCMTHGQLGDTESSVLR